MYYFLFGIHLLIAILLCIVVLLQSSKGGGLAGAFGGGGGTETVFGARGVTTILHKATVYLGTAFMLSSAGLVLYTAGRSSSTPRSLSSEAAERVPVTASPAVPTGPVPIEATAGDASTASGGEEVVPPVPTQDEGTPSSNEESGDGGGR